MAVEDVVLPSGVTLTPEDLKVIAPLVKEMLAEESKEISQFPVLDSIAGVSSLPGMTQQNELVRVPLSVLKGLDGKQVEIAASSTAIQWRYVGATSWNIIVELSVLEGAQGKPGVPPILTSGIVSTLPYNSSATAEVVSAGETEEGVPMYKINLGVPQGKPGQDGDGAGNVYVPTDNISAEKYYVFKAKVDNSVNGEFVELENLSFGVGQNYPDSINAEIFNDYENNVALGDYSHVEGSGIAVSCPVSIFSKINGGEGVEYSEYPSFLTFEVGDIHLIEGVYYKIRFVEFYQEVDGKKIPTIYYDKIAEFSTSTKEIKKIYSVAYGNSSHKEGKFSNAIGEASHAEGTYSVAVGDSSHAEGKQTIAEGIGSHSEGYMTYVYASNSHAEGRECICVGVQSHAEGMYSIAHGALSHVEGCAAFKTLEGHYDLPHEGRKSILSDPYLVRTIWNEYGFAIDETILVSSKLLEEYHIHGSFGERNHVEGVNNVAFGNGSHIEGSFNRLNGSVTAHGAFYIDHGVHIEGAHNLVFASTRDSGIHVEGTKNYLRETVDGSVVYSVYASHIEGSNNKIDVQDEANSTLKDAKFNHIGGENSLILQSSYCFVHGLGLKAISDYSVSFGKYNATEIDGKKVLFSYGIGQGDYSRENAFSILEDGSVVIPKLNGGSIDEQIKEAIIPLNNKINNNYNELKSIIDEQGQQIKDLFILLQSGVGGTKAFVAGSVLVFTKNITTEVTGETLFITDSDTTVENGVLTIK